MDDKPSHRRGMPKRAGLFLMVLALWAKMGAVPVSAAPITVSPGTTLSTSQRNIVRNVFGYWFFYKDDANGIEGKFSSSGLDWETQSAFTVFVGTNTEGEPAIWYVASSSAVYVAASAAVEANGKYSSVFVTKAVLSSSGDPAFSIGGNPWVKVPFNFVYDFSGINRCARPKPGWINITYHPDLSKIAVVAIVGSRNTGNCSTDASENNDHLWSMMRLTDSGTISPVTPIYSRSDCSTPLPSFVHIMAYPTSATRHGVLWSRSCSPMYRFNEDVSDTATGVLSVNDTDALGGVTPIDIGGASPVGGPASIAVERVGSTYRIHSVFSDSTGVLQYSRWETGDGSRFTAS